jgi:thiamine pyrophosphate-dependent acetolactate synthase large subunit-like protein
MLMGLGSLATVAAQRPANLTIVVMDNERYGETGGQLSHAALGADLAGMARAAGIADSVTLDSLDAVEQYRARLHETSGPRFALLKVAPDSPPMVLPPRDGVLLKQRFRASLG